MGHLVPYAGFPYASPPGAPRAPHLPRRPSTPRYHTAAVGGGPGESWRHGRRAGHLALDGASLVTHTTSDAGGGWPLEGTPWTVRSAKAQAPRPKTHGALITSTIIWTIQPETPISPVNTRADSVLGERQWQGRKWHTSVIPPTILIHVGSLRVPVCDALRESGVPGQ